MPNKRMLALAFFGLSFLILTASNAYASTTALVVKDKNSLSDMHEKGIYNILRDMGLNITLVDKTVSVNYNDFDLIVVAGRPVVSTREQLDSFVADIPVNDVPTIGIDSKYVVDWGWVKPSGVSSYVSSRIQDVVITDEHPLTWGFFEGEDVPVHMVQGYNIIDLVEGYTNLNIVASPNQNDRYGAVRYGLPGTVLFNGKKVSSDSAVVFFGITYPSIWTAEAEKLFKNAVKWLTSDTDGDGVIDYMDNCVYNANPSQEDRDGDRIGDACDALDNRPDLIISSINFPPERIECEGMSISVVVESIGNSASSPYAVRLQIGGTAYDAAATSLPVGQSRPTIISIGGQQLCGFVGKTVEARVISTGEMDETNNMLSEELKFTTVKMDVDWDGVMEAAKDQSGTNDGYEIYSDANSNSNSRLLDGDMDGRADYLIDVGKNGIFERYWDPDNRILSNTTYDSAGIVSIDIDGNGIMDATYNTTSGLIDYMDDTPPAVGQISVSPSFGDSTWYRFSISAPVSDAGSINTQSCEYTTDGSIWSSAEYGDGKCYKNSISAAIGSTVKINIRVKDAVNNVGMGSQVVKRVSIRPLNVQIISDKSSYSPNSSAHISGYVSYADSGEKIVGATVDYSFGSVHGKKSTDANGYYKFDLAIPNSYGAYAINVSANHTYSSGSALLELGVPEPVVETNDGTLPVGKMTAAIPDNLSAYAGSDKQFIVTADNVGFTTISSAKLSIESEIPFDVSPAMASIASGGSQDFIATLHVPEDAVGDYWLTVSVTSFGIRIEKDVELNVVEKQPELEISIMDLPEVYAGEEFDVSLSLLNIGEVEAQAVVNMTAPQGWNPVTYSLPVTIPPSSERVVSFHIIPAAGSGTIGFQVTYISNGEEVLVTDSVDVQAVQREAVQQAAPFTSMLAAAVSNPIFYIPLSVASLAAVAIVLRHAIPRTVRTTSTAGSRVLRRLPLTNSMYDRWETKRRKQW